MPFHLLFDSAYDLPFLNQIGLAPILPREKEIQLLKSKLRRFGVEEPDSEGDGNVKDSEDDVEAIVDAMDRNRGDLDHCSEELAGT